MTNVHCADSMFLCGFEYFYFHQSRLAFSGTCFLGSKNFCGFRLLVDLQGESNDFLDYTE